MFRKALSIPKTMSIVGQISSSLLQSAKSGLIQTRGSILSSLPIWSHHVASCKNRSLLKVRNFSNQRWTVQNRRRSWSNNPLFDGDNFIYALIGTNVTIFGLWIYFKQNYYWTGFMRRHFMVSSNGVIKDYRLHTLLTSSFSHNDPWHLLGNMITVYFFGRNVLSQIGGPRFAALYLGGGLVSTVSQVVWPYCIPRDFPATYKISKWSQALGMVANATFTSITYLMSSHIMSNRYLCEFST